MQRPLSAYAASLFGKKGIPLPDDVPVLVWSSTAAEDQDGLRFNTLATQGRTRPIQGEPLVCELRKRAQNPFNLGITVGRTENNDVVLDDKSISRFHAYFQRDPDGEDWRLVDASSSNGTFIQALRLLPNQGRSLVADVQLRFGDVEVRFLKPAEFRRFLKSVVEA